MQRNRESAHIPETLKPTVKNYYEVLGVPRNATSETIKKVYRRLSLEFHPDRHSEEGDEEQLAAQTRFQEINQAYEIVGDSAKRAIYDDKLNGETFENYDHQAQKLLDTLFELGSKDLLQKPPRYEQTPGREQELFDTAFPSEKAKVEATHILELAGFNRSPDIRERFPFEFIDTDPKNEDNDGMFAKFDSKALVKDKDDIDRALTWLDDRADSLSALEKTVQIFLEKLRREIYNPRMIAYSKAIDKVYGTPENKKIALELLKKGRELLKKVQAKKASDKDEEESQKQIVAMLETLLG